MQTAVSDTQFTLAIVGALSAILGAAVGSIPALVGTWLTKRSEERKHLRDLVLSAALANFNSDREVALSQPGVTRQPPLAEYILAMGRLIPIVGRPLTPEEAENEMIAFSQYLDAVNKHWDSPKTGDRAAPRAADGP